MLTRGGGGGMAGVCGVHLEKKNRFLRTFFGALRA